MLSITTLEDIFKGKLPKELIRMIYYESIRKDEKHLQEIRNNDTYYEQFINDHVPPDQYYIAKKKKKKSQRRVLMRLTDVYHYNGKIYQSVLSPKHNIYKCINVSNIEMQRIQRFYLNPLNQPIQYRVFSY